MHKCTEFLDDTFDDITKRIKEKYDNIIKEHIKYVSYDLCPSDELIKNYGKIDLVLIKSSCTNHHHSGNFEYMITSLGEVNKYLVKYDKYIIHCFYILAIRHDGTQLNPHATRYAPYVIIIDNAFNYYSVYIPNTYNFNSSNYNTIEIKINDIKIKDATIAHVNLFALTNNLIDNIKSIFNPSKKPDLYHTYILPDPEINIIITLKLTQQAFISINENNRDKCMIIAQLQSKISDVEILRHKIKKYKAKITFITKQNIAKMTKLREYYTLENASLTKNISDKITDVKTAYELASSRMCEIIRLNDKIKALKIRK